MSVPLDHIAMFTATVVRLALPARPTVRETVPSPQGTTEQMTGIEPALRPWQGLVRPIHHIYKARFLACPWESLHRLARFWRTAGFIEGRATSED